MKASASDPERDGLVVFFIAVFVITWGFGALYLLEPHRLAAYFGPVSGTNPAFRIAVAAPSIMGMVIALLFAGRAGLADLFARILHWRVGAQWYLLATAGIAALALGARWMAGTLSPTDLEPGAHWQTWLVGGLTAFRTDPGPLGEELGWRGFALPRLEQRMRGIGAALLLGTIWGIWHLPAFFIPGLHQNGFPLWAFMVSIVSLAVLVVWIVNNAGGSVIIAILAHWTANRCEALDPVTAPYTAVVFAAGAMGVIAFAGPDLGARRMCPPPLKSK